MTVLEFIFGVIIVVAVLVIALFVIGAKYNFLELEKENERLKEEIARSTRGRKKVEEK